MGHYGRKVRMVEVVPEINCDGCGSPVPEGADLYCLECYGKTSMMREENKTEVMVMEGKKWYQSGTFWGAVGKVLAGVALAINGYQEGDQTKITAGLYAVFSGWTSWRQRVGQGVPVA